MDNEHNPFQNLAKPQVARMASHRRRLKIALLTAHEHRSSVRMFGRISNDFVKCMSIGKKSTAIATVAVFGLVVAAGVFGPSASDVAQAEATSTVKRAFARFVNLSDEEKTQLEQQFQSRIHFKEHGEGMFHGMDELTVEERTAKLEETKASLQDSLTEAQAASDLQVILADEMPIPGFLGKAGRAFGFKMMRHTEEGLANLPDDIKARVQEHEALEAEMKPVKFLVYTNPDGKKVTLGVNATDETVMKFVEGEQPVGGPGVPRGPHGREGMMWNDDASGS